MLRPATYNRHTVLAQSRCVATSSHSLSAGQASCKWRTALCRSLVRMAIIGLAVSGMAGISLNGQVHAAAPHRHPEAQAIEPPFTGTPPAIESGRELYAAQCAACHGPYGLGNGRLAAGVAAYGPWPSDLTDTVWQHGSSAGEVFVVIRDGVGPEFHMPAFAAKMTEADLWNVTHFVKSLSN